MSPENDLVYPADGMRRLLAMEKTNGIWTQKMMMRVERRQVNIMDHENREVVEQFPISLVREPTAFTSNDPKVRGGDEYLLHTNMNKFDNQKHLSTSTMCIVLL